MAFSWNIFGSKKQENNEQPNGILEKNPNFVTFSQIDNDIDEAVSKRSIVTSHVTDNYINSPIYSTVSNNMQVMPIMTDKIERIKQYRSISKYTECNWCLDEICDDFIHEDDNGNIIKLYLPDNNPNINEIRKNILIDEFNKYISYFRLKEDGYNLIKRFLIEGELAFENIISKDHPDRGIIGVKFLPAEYYETLIDTKTGRQVGLFFDTEKLRNDIKLILSQSFLGAQQVFNSMLTTQNYGFNKESCIPILWPQLTYINSGELSPDGLICYPIIENCKQAYHQLSLMQDAAVILRVTRAPERLLFNVGTGKMATNAANDFVRNFANSLKAKKVVGKPGPNGMPDVAQVYNPVTMLESYVFAKSESNEGTTAESISSSANYEELGDVEYFLRRFMKQLKVPFSRYKTPENVAERDETISYEEYSFSRMIIRLMRRFELGFTKGFITHLKLRKIWEKYQLTEADIDIKMNRPILYDLYQTQKQTAVKMDTYRSIIEQEEFSKIMAMKKILGMSDDEIQQNFRMLIKEKQLTALGDYYADQLTSEGPEIFDSPIAIKGKTNDKLPALDGNDSSEDSEEGSDDENSEDSGEDSGDENSEDSEESSDSGSDEPTFGLGN